MSLIEYSFSYTLKFCHTPAWPEYPVFLKAHAISRFPDRSRGKTSKEFVTHDGYGVHLIRNWVVT